MYDDILVSVITCVYNTPAEYLKEAVQSILSQTHKNFEYFIVDDCSNKDLFADEIFNDSRINIIRLKENGGPAKARNEALKIARGKYIAIMDSDDISLPNRFSEQIAFLEENPQVVVCGTWFKQFGEKSNEVKRYIDDNEYYRCCLLFGNAPTILNPSVMLRRDVLIDNNICYDERLRLGEDYKMWVQLSRLGICTNIHKTLVNYRVHKSQTTVKNRSNTLSQYGWIVIKEQLDELGVFLTEKEENLLKINFRSREVDPFAYKQILEKIIDANSKTHIYDKEKLQKRIDEQWQQKVYNCSIPTIFSLMKKLTGTEKTKILKMQTKRILNKFKITRTD